jgi:hypothetical protein
VKINLPWTLAVIVVAVVVAIVIAAVIVVVIVPVALGMPAMVVFVPPPVCVRPAVFTRFTQLVARVDRFSAVPAVMFSGFMQPMIGFGDAPMTGLFIGSHGRRTHENEGACQRCGGKTDPQPKRFPCMNVHGYSALLKIHRYEIWFQPRIA